MAMTNSKVYNAYSQKKKNSLSPYLEAGNSAMGGSTTSSNTQSTGGSTRLYNAYAGAGTQPKATTKVARAYSMNSSPADTAYRSAASPTNEYQQGEILRKSVESGNANNTQPQSALTGAGPAGTALSANTAGEGNKSNTGAAAITSTPNTPLYSAYNPKTAVADTSAAGAQNTALYRAYGSQNGSYSGQRQSALRQAENNYNKLLNYLPEYQELMGMRGLGISNQALMNAYGKYQQSVSDINSQYDALEKEYALQQDALAKEELVTQIENANTVYVNLSDYITSAGNNFTLEGYNRFKQGLLEAGYTQQEIDAAEKMLQQSDLDFMNKQISTQEALSSNPNIIGTGIALDTAKEEDFGKYADTGKEGSGQYQLVQDILTAARSGKIPDGSIIDFNYGKHAAEKFFVYYDGYFFEINPSSVNPKKDKIIGRGRNGDNYTYQPPEIYVEDFELLSPIEQYRLREEALQSAQKTAKKD